MKATVNGTDVELPDGATVLEAAATLDLDPRRRGMAVALDGEVVPRAELERTTLSEGSHVEVVAAIQGGSR